MFPNKPPFHYRCNNCGHTFILDKKLNAPSGIIDSLYGLESNISSFESEEEIAEERITVKNNNSIEVSKKEENILNNNEYKDESFFNKMFKKIKYPKCPKCKEHSVVSTDYMFSK